MLAIVTFRSRRTASAATVSTYRVGFLPELAKAPQRRDAEIVFLFGSGFAGLGSAWTCGERSLTVAARIAGLQYRIAVCPPNCDKLVGTMDAAFVITRLESFEGRVPYPYLCTGGEVTVGIGHAIQTPAEALQLTWSINGRPATAAQIEADYTSVAGAQKGLIAQAYARLTGCRMADADIDALAASDVRSFEAQLAAALPNWGIYPPPAQAALFDMAFNLGLGGLRKFPHLLAAVDAGQWQTAAAQCHRQGIAETRNQQTAALFLQAAG